jgi:methylisocitrate lyase
MVNQLGRKTLAELTAMGQAIDVLPFVLPGIHEVWRLLLDSREAGDATPFARYMDKMNETNGTEYNIGWGQGIVRPSLEDVRKMEEKYLPADLQPDYVNTLNA